MSDLRRRQDERIERKRIREEKARRRRRILLPLLAVAAALILFLTYQAFGLMLDMIRGDKAPVETSQEVETKVESQETSAESQETVGETAAESQETSAEGQVKPLLEITQELPERFEKSTAINVPYPADGVKGIYLSAEGISNASIRQENIDLIKNSNLNAVVLDLKSDWGAIVSNLDSDHPWIQENTNKIYDMEETMQIFEDNQIYPIARIVVFRDYMLSNKHPDQTFRNPDGSSWVRANGDMFSNPFSKEVWEYNVEVAKAAAKAGFKEIQFDYIRYPETFGSIQDNLTFSMGVYEGSTEPLSVLRVRAINDFLDYARKELEPYDVKLGVDIFGYTATIPEDSDIGQNFSDMAEKVDVVSSMIYPSHWGLSYFGIDKPDTKPYELTKAYIEQEASVLSQVTNPVTTRPWLQDFTASYLGAGNYIQYGPDQVLAQTKALEEAGVHEFLLWNAGNKYTKLSEY